MYFYEGYGECVSDQTVVVPVANPTASMTTSSMSRVENVRLYAMS